MKIIEFLLKILFYLLGAGICLIPVGIATWLTLKYGFNLI